MGNIVFLQRLYLFPSIRRSTGKMIEDPDTDITQIPETPEPFLDGFRFSAFRKASNTLEALGSVATATIEFYDPKGMGLSVSFWFWTITNTSLGTLWAPADPTVSASGLQVCPDFTTGKGDDMVVTAWYFPPGGKTPDRDTFDGWVLGKSVATIDETPISSCAPFPDAQEKPPNDDVVDTSSLPATEIVTFKPFLPTGTIQQFAGTTTFFGMTPSYSSDIDYKVNQGDAAAVVVLYAIPQDICIPIGFGAYTPPSVLTDLHGLTYVFFANQDGQLMVMIRENEFLSYTLPATLGLPSTTVGSYQGIATLWQPIVPVLNTVADTDKGCIELYFLDQFGQLSCARQLYGALLYENDLDWGDVIASPAIPLPDLSTPVGTPAVQIDATAVNVFVRGSNGSVWERQRAADPNDIQNYFVSGPSWIAAQKAAPPNEVGPPALPGVTAPSPPGQAWADWGIDVHAFDFFNFGYGGSYPLPRPLATNAASDPVVAPYGIPMAVISPLNVTVDGPDLMGPELVFFLGTADEKPQAIWNSYNLIPPPAPFVNNDLDIDFTILRDIFLPVSIAGSMTRLSGSDTPEALPTKENRLTMSDVDIIGDPAVLWNATELLYWVAAVDSNSEVWIAANFQTFDWDDFVASKVGLDGVISHDGVIAACLDSNNLVNLFVQDQYGALNVNVQAGPFTNASGITFSGWKVLKRCWDGYFSFSRFSVALGDDGLMRVFLTALDGQGTIIVVEQTTLPTSPPTFGSGW